VALEVFGPDRLLFGTDYPVLKLAGELEQWIDVYKLSISDLTEAEQAKINELNCKNIYALD
jgi:L-fuconolactonase